ncbi:zinc transporter ZntB [Paralimibaculum aggregatum]|uniref:Zinc transporter ZntB n=1 Tax=Paralimibaculum aggregatum TaxID=3036245 RepID=A0ABQ6LRD3_9RHOB|nr:CorA family divalent cation transporter [Limibaculum sp. NKW23]GMG83879.1 zinc transporter ZntB [Limibaculum sp. NKW23]
MVVEIAEDWGRPVVDVEAGADGARWRWTHLCFSARTEGVLRDEIGLAEEIADALLERDTLPRVLTVEGSTLLILRGINQLEGAEPEDMISLRLVISEQRVLSLEFRRLRQIDRMIEAFRRGEPPATPGAFVTRLVELLRADVEPVLDGLERDIDGLERRLLRVGAELGKDERALLIDARQDAIQLTRYIAPQAHALETLAGLKPGWLGSRRRLRSEAAAFQRIAQDLEAVRARAQLVAEEASMAVTERTSRVMLTLSAVSVVFLPITALTGLLGVNLAGIPYAEAPWAFAAFCVLLLGVMGLAIWLAVRMLR